MPQIRTTISDTFENCSNLVELVIDSRMAEFFWDVPINFFFSNVFSN